MRPLTWDGFDPNFRSVFRSVRSEAGEAMILEHNVFVEQILPRGILRTLTDAEMAEYR